jgi:hypothetical protein
MLNKFIKNKSYTVINSKVKVKVAPFPSELFSAHILPP